MARIFKINQIVRLVGQGLLPRSASPTGLYEIIGLMPMDQRGEFSYLLKSKVGHRIAREFQMEASAAETH